MDASDNAGKLDTRGQFLLNLDVCRRLPSGSLEWANYSCTSSLSTILETIAEAVGTSEGAVLRVRRVR